jgi:hypothetical protein
MDSQSVKLLIRVRLQTSNQVFWKVLSNTQISYALSIGDIEHA